MKNVGRPPLNIKHRQTLVCEYEEKIRIEAIAHRLGYTHGGVGSFGKLIRALGQGELLVGSEAKVRAPTKGDVETLNNILSLVPHHDLKHVKKIVKMLASGECNLISSRR